MRWGFMARCSTVLFALALLLIVGKANGSQSVDLAWDASPPDQNVVGYLVYFGTSSRDYTQSQDTPTPSSTIAGLTEGCVYYFAVTAYTNNRKNTAFGTAIISDDHLIDFIVNDDWIQVIYP